MRVHQILGSLEFGDAVATYALTVQGLLRGLGHESEIFTAACDPRMSDRRRALGEMPAQDGLVIYHHTFWNEPALESFRSFAGSRAMVYHNVTPEHCFAGYSDELRESAHRARAVLAELRTEVDLPVAVSDFNRREMTALGYREVAVLPMPVALEGLAATAPDPATLRVQRDGAVNFLFVGRLVPSKRQEDVIRVFAWYHRYIHRPARLVLVGSAPEIESYRQDLGAVARDCRVKEHVLFAGKVSQAELVAYYRTASVFLCMSEHEGFCAPLVEAMHFDVPVLARACGAVPETLGDAGVLVRERDMPRIASAAHLLVRDRELRAKVLARQRERLDDFRPERFRDAFAAWAARLSAV